MATVTTALKAAGNVGNPTRVPYYVENVIDFADHTVDCSSGDVVQAITIPANTMIVAAGAEIVSACTITSTGADENATLGTDLDADKFVAVLDLDAGTAGTYGATVTGTGGFEVHGTANTLDLTLSGTGTDITAGKVRVFAVLMDIDAHGGGDKSAAEAVRDYLA
jgi:hypothetical protein